MDYFRPATLADALTLKAQAGVRVLAGGTDFYPALRDRPVNYPVLDISAVAGLRQIRQNEDGWSIGANVTWTDILRNALPKALDGLKLAARELGSLQIQNRGTVVGNLCNASPAADGVPPLLVVDAEVEIASRRGLRREALSHFVKGNRKTSLAPDEIVIRIIVPNTSAVGHSHFVKLGSRKFLVISIAMVAVRIELQRKRISKAAIAVGSCAETAKRLSKLETILIGHGAKDVTNLVIDPQLFESLSPIDDIRATASYRNDAVDVLVRDCVLQAMGQVP
jgi:CO/xanthine dehydrogenase FAD-binding subunit